MYVRMYARTYMLYTVVHIESAHRSAMLLLKLEDCCLHTLLLVQELLPAHLLQAVW